MAGRISDASINAVRERLSDRRGRQRSRRASARRVAGGSRACARSTTRRRRRSTSTPPSASTTASAAGPGCVRPHRAAGEPVVHRGRRGARAPARCRGSPTRGRCRGGNRETGKRQRLRRGPRRRGSSSTRQQLRTPGGGGPAGVPARARVRRGGAGRGSASATPPPTGTRWPSTCAGGVSRPETLFAAGLRVAGQPRRRSTGSAAGCSGRSATRRATSSGSAPAGSATTTGSTAKYLNTSETPLYKKSQVLYGLDLAKNDIAKKYKAVVVEGYTDVMACHLAGETTAVATCGTAFGAEHVQMLRRFLMDQDEFRGPGHLHLRRRRGGAQGGSSRRSATTNASWRRRSSRSSRTGSTRASCGSGTVTSPSATSSRGTSRSPSSRSARRSQSSTSSYREGRVAALAAAAPVVAHLKDWALRDEYARRLAGWLGMDDAGSVLARVRGQAGAERGRAARRAAVRPRRAGPTRATRRIGEREGLKLAVQRPALGRGLRRP